jgi:hypothetical protein
MPTITITGGKTANPIQPNATSLDQNRRNWQRLVASGVTAYAVLNTLGDLLVYGTAGPTRLPVGTNGQVLTADSTKADGLAWESVSPQLYSGSVSDTAASTTSFVVTIPAQAATTYQVAVTPTNALAAALFYVSAKGLSSFTVTYLTALTGTVTFDWIVTP